MTRFLLFSLFAATLVLSACNDRRRGPVDGTDPLCPDFAVSTGAGCDVDQAGITCSGTVSCSCGERSTSCTCGDVGGGIYAFSCVDSCSSCTSGDGGIGAARCGALYDRLQSSPCPYPPDLFSREEFVAQCMSLSVSDACRAEFETFISCALTADIVCEDVGDGMRFPTVPGCDPVSSMCTGG